jgi:hypothetical protein
VIVSLAVSNIAVPEEFTTIELAVGKVLSTLMVANTTVDRLFPESTA